MNLNSSVKMGGRFKIGVLEPQSKERFETPWVSNLILDNAKTIMFTGFPEGHKPINIGSSFAPSTTNQTTVFTPLPFEVLSEENLGLIDYTTTMVGLEDIEIQATGGSKFTLRSLGDGVVNEIGIDNFCRALLVNSSLNNEGIPISPSTILEIVYEFTMVYTVKSSSLLNVTISQDSHTPGYDELPQLGLKATPARTTMGGDSFEWGKLLSQDKIWRFADASIDTTNAVNLSDYGPIDRVMTNQLENDLEVVGSFRLSDDGFISGFYFGNSFFGVHYSLTNNDTQQAYDLTVSRDDTVIVTSTLNWLRA